MKSFFQPLLLFIFGAAAVIAMLIFSGVLPGFKAKTGGTGGTVVVWSPYPGSNELTAYVADFNKKNSSSVNLVYVSKNAETYENDLIEALATGAGPDIFFLPDNLIIKHQDKVFPIPYQTYPLRTFKDTFADAGEIFLADIGVIAFPVAINPLVMYYNRDLFSQASVSVIPKTWTDFVGASQSITKLDTNNNIIQSGLAFGEFLNVSNARDIILLLLNQAGNPVISRIGDKYVSSLSDSFGVSPTPTEATFAFFTQFADQAKTAYSWNKSLPEAKDSFTAGKLATYFGFANELADLRVKNPHLNLDVSVVPQKNENSKVTYGRVMGLAISRNSKNPAGAASAIYLLTDKDNDTIMANLIGWVPARRDLLGLAQADPFNDVFYKSAIVARGFTDPNYAGTLRIFKNIAQAFQIGLTVTTQALSDANGELQLLIK